MTDEISLARFAHLADQLEEAFKKREMPLFESAGPNQWALACELLVKKQSFDAVAYSARHLLTLYPELGYAKSLTTLFDNIPNGPAPLLDFSDDQTADVQVISRPGSNGVLLVFCGAVHQIGLPVGLMHRWLGRLPLSIIYLRDFRKLAGGMGYPSLGSDRTSSVRALRSVISHLGAQNIFAYGNCIGVFAALHYGLTLKPRAVLCISGFTNLTPEFNADLVCRNEFGAYHQNVRDYATDLRSLYAMAENPPKVLLVYGKENAKARKHAENLAGLPTVELIPIENCPEHPVAVKLLKRGLFSNLLERFIAQ
jgi:hypothetical protein